MTKRSTMLSTCGRRFPQNDHHRLRPDFVNREARNTVIFPETNWTVKYRLAGKAANSLILPAAVPWCAQPVVRPCFPCRPSSWTLMCHSVRTWSSPESLSGVASVMGKRGADKLTHLHSLHCTGFSYLSYLNVLLLDRADMDTAWERGGSFSFPSLRETMEEQWHVYISLCPLKRGRDPRLESTFQLPRALHQAIDSRTTGPTTPSTLNGLSSCFFFSLFSFFGFRLLILMLYSTNCPIGTSQILFPLESEPRCRTDAGRMHAVCRSLGWSRCSLTLLLQDWPDAGQQANGHLFESEPC